MKIAMMIVNSEDRPTSLTSSTGLPGQSYRASNADIAVERDATYRQTCRAASRQRVYMDTYALGQSPETEEKALCLFISRNRLHSVEKEKLLSIHIR